MLLSYKQIIPQVDPAVNDKMFGQKYGLKKNDIGKTSRREVSSPESETGRKGSKSGAPAEIGRYHMYVCSSKQYRFSFFGRGSFKQHSYEV